jgi:DNA (cytosine-5)-methyltransferase 1
MKQDNSDQALRMVSLFSGAGGLDIGLTRAGFTPVLCIEMDKDCCATLRMNGVAESVIESDIRNVSDDFIREALGPSRQEVDLLAGGPPCPPYSKSRFYRTEKPRALDDPAAVTLHEYLRVLAVLRPRAFLLENVPGLAYKVHADALKLILDQASQLGYATQYRILNAADYGVPQIRERLFIVGLRNGDEFKFPEPTHQKAGSQGELFGARPYWVTAGEVLHDLDTVENADDTGHRAGGKYHDLLKDIPPGENYLHFTAERGHPNPQFRWRSRYWSFLLKLSPKQPSWTIQARRSNNMGPLHWQNRILRIEEVKRLQTFPDDWSLAGRIESQWRQVGNAVPPLLAQALGLSLRQALAAGLETRTGDSDDGRK